MPPGPDPSGPHPLADEDPNAEYYHLVLREILDAGVSVAQAIKHDAAAHTIATMRGEADPRDTTAADLAVAYERTARAVRRTVALARRVSALPARTRHSSTAARKRIIREVEAAIDRQRGDDAPETDDLTDDLRADFHERLDDPALDGDIATRPIPDIIADICRDLGLAARLPAAPGQAHTAHSGSTPRDCKRRLPEDLQNLIVRAAHPPTAAHPNGRDPPPAAPPPDS